MNPWLAYGRKEGSLFALDTGIDCFQFKPTDQVPLLRGNSLVPMIGISLHIVFSTGSIHLCPVADYRAVSAYIWIIHLIIVSI